MNSTALAHSHSTLPLHTWALSVAPTSNLTNATWDGISSTVAGLMSALFLSTLFAPNVTLVSNGVLFALGRFRLSAELRGWGGLWGKLWAAWSYDEVLPSWVAWEWSCLWPSLVVGTVHTIPGFMTNPALSKAFCCGPRKAWLPHKTLPWLGTVLLLWSSGKGSIGHENGSGWLLWPLNGKNNGVPASHGGKMPCMSTSCSKWSPWLATLLLLSNQSNGCVGHGTCSCWLIWSLKGKHNGMLVSPRGTLPCISTPCAKAPPGWSKWSPWLAQLLLFANTCKGSVGHGNGSGMGPVSHGGNMPCMLTSCAKAKPGWNKWSPWLAKLLLFANTCKGSVGHGNGSCWLIWSLKGKHNGMLVSPRGTLPCISTSCAKAPPGWSKWSPWLAQLLLFANTCKGSVGNGNGSGKGPVSHGGNMPCMLTSCAKAKPGWNRWSPWLATLLLFANTCKGSVNPNNGSGNGPVTHGGKMPCKSTFTGFRLFSMPTPWGNSCSRLPLSYACGIHIGDTLNMWLTSTPCKCKLFWLHWSSVPSITSIAGK